MYKIARESREVLGMTEAPTYVKRARNGSYTLYPEPQAFLGAVYHLPGREPLEDTETVMLEETDTGAEIHTAQQAAADADGMLVNQEYRLTLLELGVREEG